ncbi:putative F-box protein PP2-B12 [Spinacia oleracea]|uniref:F-box protein PP2-B12 n=1 Tax=Spinacia oleracea TaxID=3562 RepID=A0A9R0JXQ3_SPIOL|nr:putative F-box protein PP2-B12 [Spinacia oleracea]
MSSCMNLLELPEGCLSHILSLTSPRDVVRSSAVSKQFLSASDSDSVWKKFFPSDCDYFISQSSTPIDQQLFASKKELFLYLCRSPLLFNNNTQSFALDKWSGKKCFMLGARMLTITWGDTPEYWSWESIPESRFPEVAQLNSVCWLNIKGILPTKFLSHNTTYGVYFVFRKIDDFYGFDIPVMTSVFEVDGEGLSNGIDIVNHYYLEEPEDDESPTSRDELPVERGDGWLEVEMGKYRVGFGGEGVVDEKAVLEMSLKEVEELNWKGGIVVQGIELRPLGCAPQPIPEQAYFCDATQGVDHPGEPGPLDPEIIYARLRQLELNQEALTSRFDRFESLFDRFESLFDRFESRFDRFESDQQRAMFPIYDYYASQGVVGEFSEHPSWFQYPPGGYAVPGTHGTYMPITHVGGQGSYGAGGRGAGPSGGRYGDDDDGDDNDIGDVSIPL